MARHTRPTHGTYADAKGLAKQHVLSKTATGEPEYVDGPFSDEKGYSPKD